MEDPLRTMADQNATLRVSSWGLDGTQSHAPLLSIQQLQPGIEVGNYQIKRVLGQGGMGVVFEAHDTQLKRTVALKTLPHPEAMGLLNLKHEFRVVADLWHPNIVKVHELIVDTSHCLIAMEMVHGQAFPALPRELVGINRWELLSKRLVMLFDAIDALHSSGVLHLDIKPSNVLVDETGRVVVLDFGISSLLFDQNFEKPKRAGTPAYMAPEVIAGEAPQTAADVFALGVLLYESLVGHPPFLGTLSEVIQYRQQGPLWPPSEWLPGVPAHLDALCMEMMALSPADRPSLAQARAVLQRATHRLNQPSVEDVFLGREKELAKLHAVFKQRSVAPKILLLEGESGIGKSALVQKFMEDIADQGGMILSGRCHMREAIPFKAMDGLVDGLARWLHSPRGAELYVTVLEDLQVVARLFPVLGPHERRYDDPMEARRQAIQAFRRVLLAVGQAYPLLLWIDDLQWGDVDSAALLADLLADVQAPPIMIILSMRNREEGAFFEFFQNRLKVLNGPGIETQRLLPLPTDAAFALATHILSVKQENKERIEELVNFSGGNPFLICYTNTHLKQLPSASRRLFETLCVAAAPIATRLALGTLMIEAEDDPIAPLVAHRLISYRLMNNTPRLACYHNRLRETWLQSISPQEQQEIHQRIAQTAIKTNDLPSETIGWHLYQGGQPIEAANYAERAAEEAMELLAFDQAAACLAQVIEWRGPSHPHYVALLSKQGQALAYAGRGAAAAESLLKASQVDVPQAPQLRLLAAEHLLISGFLERGLGILAPLSRQAGVSFPMAAPWLILRVLLQAIWWGLWGIRLNPKAEPRSSLQQQAANLCWAGCKGLAAVDPFRAVHLALQGVRRGAADGQETEVLRGLGVVAVIALGPLGGRPGQWADRILQHVETRAQAIENPILVASAHVFKSNNLLVSANWKESQQLASAALQTLRVQAPTAWWEQNMAILVLLRAFEEVGRFAEQEKLAMELLERSVEHDDRYGQYMASQGAIISRFASWDFDTVRHFIDQSEQVWTPTGFHIQHFYVAKWRALCDLGEGNVQSALEHLNTLWGPLQRSGFLAAPILRLDAYGLRATIYAQLGLSRGQPRYLKQAINDAKKLARDPRPNIAARGQMLQGALSAPVAGIPLLKQAMHTFQAADQIQLVAVCQRRLAQMENNPQLVQASEAQLQAMGIKYPERWAEIYAPGGFQITNKL